MGKLLVFLMIMLALLVPMSFGESDVPDDPGPPCPQCEGGDDGPPEDEGDDGNGGGGEEDPGEGAPF